MQIAVLVNRDSLLTLGQGKNRFGRLAGLEIFDLAALIGFQGNPLNKVLRAMLLGLGEHTRVIQLSGSGTFPVEVEKRDGRTVRVTIGGPVALEAPRWVELPDAAGLD